MRTHLPLTLVFAALLMAGMVAFLPAAAQSRVALQSTPSNTPNPPPATIRGFHLVSPTEGWLWMNRLYWTKDSGQTWTDITPPNLNGMGMWAGAFVDDQHGAVIEGTIDSTGVTYAIAQTSDGGKTWTIKPLNLFSQKDNSDAYPGAVSLQFLDVNTGWLQIERMSSVNVDIGTLFKTIDGGTTWTKLNLPRNKYNTFIGDPVYFVTDQLGWIVGIGNGVSDGILYRTQDGGQTWQIQTIGKLTPDIVEWHYQLPQFANSQDGILPMSTIKDTNATFEFYITHDSGQTWQLGRTISVKLNSPGEFKLVMALTDSTHWIAVLPQKRIETMSQDATPSILTQDTAVADVGEFDFVSTSIGWALSSRGSCTTPPSPTPVQCAIQEQLLHTNDGGKTWKPLILPETNPTILSSITTRVNSQGFDTAYPQ